MNKYTIETLVLAIIKEISEVAKSLPYIYAGITDKDIYYINQNSFGGTYRTMELAERICDIDIFYDSDNPFVVAQLFKNGTLTITAYEECGAKLMESTTNNFCKYCEVNRLASRLSRYVDDEGIINGLFINAIDTSRNFDMLQKFERNFVNNITNYCNPFSENRLDSRKFFKLFSIYDCHRTLEYDRLSRYIYDEEYRKCFFNEHLWRPELSNTDIRKEIEEKAIKKCERTLNMLRNNII